MKPLIKKSWCVKEGQKSNFRRVENENGDKWVLLDDMAGGRNM